MVGPPNNEKNGFLAPPLSEVLVSCDQRAMVLLGCSSAQALRPYLLAAAAAGGDYFGAEKTNG